MKEVAFLNKNIEKWKRFEDMLKSDSGSTPDEIAGLYIHLTDDLAYARTYYHGSNVTKYLNELTFKAHQVIYKNKKEKKNRIIEFWKYDFPLEFHVSRRFFYYSLIIFMLAFILGMFSTAVDDTYTRLILGDSYVNMTLENIEKGDPMAVYKSSNEADTFFSILMNNIWVTLRTYVYGILLMVGTALALIYNGVMLGTFEYFFFQKGLLWQSFLSIWIHGTIEIFSIVVAGGAGLLMGSGLLFPGTHSRMRALIINARRGLIIIIGILPFICIAAFLEGIATRHTEWPTYLRLSIILGSFFFLIFYFFIYPLKLKK